MKDILLALFKNHWGEEALRIELLPASGSARRYYRMFAKGQTYIGTYNPVAEENRLFIDFSRHFKEKGLHVPEIYCLSDDEKAYVQQDLGDVQLLDVVEEGRGGQELPEKVMSFYRQALRELVRFQLDGHEGLDYSRCMPRPVFDRQCMLWDLNYFKYCFLKLASVDFSEQALEDDFNRLADVLASVPADGFMFRDFQSRNIMVKDREVWFIDYQGGRRGALLYDVASLLYDAIAGIPDGQREELLNTYLDELQNRRHIDRKVFRRVYGHFVLIRLLQAMGAFGLRGLYERKQHFIDSILPGLRNVLDLFDKEGCALNYPAIREVCEKAYRKYDCR